MTLARVASVLALTVFSTPVLADAVTYRGTLGKLPVVVEFTGEVSDATAPFAGRYFYPAKGIDIPLDGLDIAPGAIELAEELPCTEETCTEETCTRPDDGAPVVPPLGAHWSLALTDDGEGLAGQWSDGKKTLPIALARVGSRPFGDNEPSTPEGLVDAGIEFLFREARITAESSPYDYLRLQVPLQQGPETAWNDSAFRYVVDPRTRFAYPRITRLAGGADPSAANATLEANHFSMSLDALNCPSRAYAGLGWDGSAAYADELGGYPDETVAVTYLSPRVMSWTESGSLFCGGAYPENHHSFFNMDVATGEPLDLSRIFSGWLPSPEGDPVDLDTAPQAPGDYIWGPDAALADFVRSHRTVSDDAEFESECGIDALIEENLAISFIEGDRVLFGLDHLPHAIQACGDDLYEAPIAELRAFLTPEAADYFPSLAAAE